MSILNEIEDLKAKIEVRRLGISNLRDNLKYADGAAYSADLTRIKDAQLELGSRLEDLAYLEQEAGIAHEPARKEQKLTLFVYEHIDTHCDEKFAVSTSELDLNFTDKMKMVFVGSTEVTFSLNAIDAKTEMQAIRHRDEMRLRFELEQKINEQNYDGVRLKAS